MKKNISKLLFKTTNTFKRYFKTKLLCYYIHGCNYQYNIVFPIKVASSIQHLSNIKCDEDFLIAAKERFHYGQILYYCCDKNAIVGYGWKASNNSIFYVWEIANNIHFSQNVEILYNFFVYPKYRRRGIYKSILHYIINHSSEESLLVIYADSNNIGSNKAIVECGFHLIDTLSFFSNKITRFTPKKD